MEQEIQEIVKVLSHRAIWELFGAYYILMAIIGGMPTPEVQNGHATWKASGWYQWLFRSLHLLAGNINRAAVALKVPGSAQNSDQSNA